ncbi:hypothetical protein [Haloarchaeobius sp. TZWWS8]|uniref:hypothetical protein n=1 Tax=Haloarchaeobius sp. TZWWS8 TaxID=3446121 RepID=UPI003EC03A81
MWGVLVSILTGLLCCAVLFYATRRRSSGSLSTTDFRRVTGPTFASLSFVALAIGEEAGQQVVGRSIGGFLILVTLIVAKDALFDGVVWLLRLRPQ